MQNKQWPHTLRAGLEQTEKCYFAERCGCIAGCAGILHVSLHGDAAFARPWHVTLLLTLSMSASDSEKLRFTIEALRRGDPFKSPRVSPGVCRAISWLAARSPMQV